MNAWMVVEDEMDIHEMLLALSETLGHNGIGFFAGEDAVDWIANVDAGDYSGPLPELALLDIRLPDAISGPMVGARLRQSPVLKNVAIVLITAYRLKPHEEESLVAEAGADMLLYKPLPGLLEFQEILRTVVAQR